MKKVLALLLAIILVVSLSACSTSSTNETTNETTSEATNEPETVLMEELTEEITDEQQEDEKTNGDSGDYDAILSVVNELIDLDHYDSREFGSSYLYTLKKEFWPDYMADDEVNIIESRKLNHMVIPVGMTVPQLLEQGWEFKNVADGNKTVPAHRYGPKAALINGNKSIVVEFSNSSDDSLKYKEAEIYAIQNTLYSYNSDHALEKKDTAVAMVVNDIISEESELKDVIDAFGDPYQITVHADKNNENTIKVSYSDWKIGGLSFTFNGDGTVLISGTVFI